MDKIIKEDYCSYEIAKLLKEKGFDEPCYQKYDNEGYLSFNHVGYINAEKPNENFSALAPTHQMSMAWLRKVHNIHIAIVPCEVGPGVMDYTYILYKVDAENFIFKNLGIQGRANTDKMSASKTCGAAIKYCLEHLI